MINRTTISGNTPQELWQHFYNDFAQAGTHDYHVVINHKEHEVFINIVSSPGGGADGGYDYTTITTHLPRHTGLTFSIQPEDLLKKIGKFFGAQDIVVGHPEFDDNVIVKTNNEAQLKKILDHEDVRNVFQALSGFSLGVVEHDRKEGPHLELLVQRAITNVGELQKIFDAFAIVLDNLTEE
jgi:hypothetical protein